VTNDNTPVLHPPSAELSVGGLIPRPRGLYRAPVAVARPVPYQAAVILGTTDAGLPAVLRWTSLEWGYDLHEAIERACLTAWWGTPHLARPGSLG
jgi:hypothetical protein